MGLCTHRLDTRESFVVRLSIVIPHSTTVEVLEQTLLSVLSNRPRDCEVLVVQVRPYADPYQLADEVHFLEALGAGLLEAINRGVQAAQAPIVQILLEGVEVASEWTKPALRHFGDRRVAAVAPGIFDATSPERLLAAGWILSPSGRIRPAPFSHEQEKPIDHESAKSNGSSRRQEKPSALCPDPTSVFVRKETFLALGGLGEQWNPRAAWIEMGLVIHRTGFRTVAEPACQVWVPPELTRWCSAWRDARDTERLFWQWTSRPISLGRLARHVLAIVGDSLSVGPTPRGILRFGGRLVGMVVGMQMPSSRHPSRRIATSGSSAIPAPHFGPYRPHTFRSGRHSHTASLSKHS